MNAVWLKQLQMHHKIKYPGSPIIDAEELQRALKLLPQCTQNQAILHAVKNRELQRALKLLPQCTQNQAILHAVKNKSEEQLATKGKEEIDFAEFLGRIGDTFKDKEDSIFIEAYFSLIDKDKDGFVSYEDTKAAAEDCQLLTMQEQVFQVLAEKTSGNQSKFSKQEFKEMVKQYI